jgi:hypothetical protein
MTASPRLGRHGVSEDAAASDAKLIACEVTANTEMLRGSADSKAAGQVSNQRLCLRPLRAAFLGGIGWAVEPQ